jgi:phosphoenolpyruvate-protein phosphotransferase (PTS system enzyme I)
MRDYKGIAASPGVAVGPVFLYAPPVVTIPEDTVPPSERAAEAEAFRRGRDRAAAELEALRERVRAERGDDLAEVFDGHLAILTDEGLEENILTAIAEGHRALAAARDAIEAERAEFLALDDEYLRQRADDMADIGRRLVLGIAGLDAAGLESVPAGSVIVARDLTPSDTAQLDPARIAGFVVAKGGRTSHVAIMARTMELPAVVGCADILTGLPPGAAIALDGATGEVTVDPDAAARAAFARRREDWIRDQAAMRELAPLPAVTLDGTSVVLAANIGTPADAEAALPWNPDGVGLFRTEFLFMSRPDLPDEQEQFKAYAKAVKLMRGKPVIIRTLDVGGDKPVAALPFPPEENPFLGWRGARLALYRGGADTSGVDPRAMMTTQLRAALRAAAEGEVWIMFPMISNREEIAALRAMTEEARDQLSGEGVKFGPAKLGVMIETPGAALIADKLARAVDFFSIGSNDLTQYTLAADRGNEAVADCYQPFHPGVWRLIANVISAAHAAGKPVGVCGELAGIPEAALPLLGLGLDEFSMGAPSLPHVKRVIRAATMERAKAVAARVCDADTAAEAFAIATDAMRGLFAGR